VITDAAGQFVYRPDVPVAVRLIDADIAGHSIVAAGCGDGALEIL